MRLDHIMFLVFCGALVLGLRSLRKPDAMEEMVRKDMENWRRDIGDTTDGYPTSSSFRKQQAAREKFLREHCRLATANDYKTWLYGHIDRNPDVKFARRFTVNFNQYDTWYVLTKTCIIPNFKGGNAMHFIVPENVEVYVSHCKLGHNVVYFMDDFSMFTNGLHEPPIFKNLKPE